MKKLFLTALLAISTSAYATDCVIRVGNVLVRSKDIIFAQTVSLGGANVQIYIRGNDSNEVLRPLVSMKDWPTAQEAMDQIRKAMNGECK